MTEASSGLESEHDLGVDPEALERGERFKGAVEAIADGREAMDEFANRHGISYEYSFFGSDCTLFPQIPVTVTSHSEQGMLPMTYPLGEAIETTEPIEISGIDIDRRDEAGLVWVSGRTASDQEGNFNSVRFAPRQHLISIEITEQTDSHIQVHT
jgi:hypothetical protein